MNIQLPTGKTVYVSTYEFLFKTEDGKVVYTTDDEIEDFYRNAMADDLGSFVEDPFHGCVSETLEIQSDETLSVEEAPVDEPFEP